VLAGATRTVSHQRARSMWASPTLRPGRIARSHPLARHAPRPPAMHQEMWLAPSTQIAPSYWSAGWASWGPGEVEQACGQLGPGCHAGCPRRPGRAERGVRAGVWAFRVRVLVTVGPTREANRPRGERLLPRAPKTQLPRQLVPIEPRPRHTGGTLDGEKPQLSTGGDSEPVSATLCVGCCCVL
jgi:hypothetical protein